MKKNRNIENEIKDKKRGDKEEQNDVLEKNGEREK